MKFKNLIFDLDGTLLNSFEGIYNGFVYAFKKNNQPMREDKINSFIGPPLYDSFRSLYDDEELVNKMVESYREYYLPIGQNESKLYDGTEEMLKILSEKGYKLYVATCKPVKIANEIFKNKGIEKYFKGIYAALDDNSTSNKQSVLKYLFEKENIKRDESLMIGDTIYDILGAEDADIKVAIATFGFGDMREMKKHKIEFFYNSPKELTTIL